MDTAGSAEDVTLAAGLFVLYGFLLGFVVASILNCFGPAPPIG